MVVDLAVEEHRDAAIAVLDRLVAGDEVDDREASKRGAREGEYEHVLRVRTTMRNRARHGGKTCGKFVGGSERREKVDASETTHGSRDILSVGPLGYWSLQDGLQAIHASLGRHPDDFAQAAQPRTLPADQLVRVAADAVAQFGAVLVAAA